jgi:hypothetical protein
MVFIDLKFFRTMPSLTFMNHLIHSRSVLNLKLDETICVQISELRKESRPLEVA